MLSGTFYGIDVGAARVGVARSVSSLLPAMPIATLKRDPEENSDIKDVLAMVEEEAVAIIYVGLPLNLQGRHTPSTDAARQWAQTLAELLVQAGHETEVRLVDERLSTVGAQRKMRQAGRSAKKQKSVIDQQAAVEILQQALDMQESLQRNIGELVDGNQEG